MEGHDDRILWHLNSINPKKAVIGRDLCLFPAPLSTVPFLDLLSQNRTGSLARGTIYIVVRHQAYGVSSHRPRKNIMAGQSAYQGLCVSSAAQAEDHDVGLDQRWIQLHLGKFAQGAGQEFG